MTNLIDTDLILELQDRFGEIFAQALVDHLTRIPGGDRDPECLEVLQMSEIAHRLKEHVREMIRECRALEARSYVCQNEMFYLDREIAMRRRQIVTRDASGKVTGGLYALYKGAWTDFLAFFDAYMHKCGKSPQESAALRERASSRGRFLADQQRQTAARQDYLSTYRKTA